MILSQKILSRFIYFQPQSQEIQKFSIKVTSERKQGWHRRLVQVQGVHQRCQLVRHGFRGQAPQAKEGQKEEEEEEAGEGGSQRRGGGVSFRYVCE